MRTKRSILIFITDVVPLIIVSILGIFRLKIFLNELGQDTLGLYQLFSQIMIYIALVDGGLTNAVLFALYKPNAENDNKKLYRILLGAKKVFSAIGSIIFFIAFLISFFVPFFIKDASFSNLYISCTFLLFSLSNVFSYFVVPEQVIFEVKEKKYICNLINQGFQILQNVFEIILLLNGFSFVYVLILHIIIKFTSNLIIYIIAHKKYKNTYKNLKPDYSFTSQIKHLMVHKINGLVGSNIDILIISKFIGLSSVAIYSIYSYIGNMLNTIISKFATSITAIIGNYMEKDINGANKIYLEINNMMFYVAIVVSTTLLFAINSFINIWYENQIFTSFLIALSFSLLLFINIIIQPVCTYLNSSGLFKETKKYAVCDTTLNLILSFTLVWLFKISGVVIATVISMFINQFIMKNIVLYKNKFNTTSKNFFLGNTKFFIIFILDIFVSYLIFVDFSVTNIVIWFAVFGVYFILNALLVLLTFKFLKASSFIARFKLVFKTKKW